MTNSRKFRQSYSLRAHKSPRLLDSGSCYNHLEEASLPVEGFGCAGTYRGSSRIPPKEEIQQGAGWIKGNWGRRAASLRVPKVGGDETKVGGDETLGEAAHSLGPGDGQLLIREAHSMADSRVKKCKQQVNRSLRQGWKTFVTNLNSLTLSRPTKRQTAGPPQVVGGAP